MSARVYFCSYCLSILLTKQTWRKLHKKVVAIINEATTLCRHQQANHPMEYRKWAADNNFESMLS